MATTTTNYGFDIPQSTDLVKDGATAIATLGQDIDTAMNTALGTKKAGMVLLNTTSFSAVASQSFNNVFSASYTNYFIVFQGTVATSADFINLRLRVGGVDNSTASSYGRQSLSGNGASASAFSETNTSFRTIFRGDTNSMVGNLYIYRPFAASSTFFQTMTGDGSNLTTATGYHNQSVSYDGFSLIANGNNFSGTLTTYGLNT
jgi:hypothetical protein